MGDRVLTKTRLTHKSQQNLDKSLGCEINLKFARFNAEHLDEYTEHQRKSLNELIN